MLEDHRRKEGVGPEHRLVADWSHLSLETKNSNLVYNLHLDENPLINNVEEKS